MFALCALDKDTMHVVLSNLDLCTLLLVRTTNKELMRHVKDNMLARGGDILTMTFTHCKRIVFPCTTRASSVFNPYFCWQAFVSLLKFEDSLNESLDDMLCKIGRLSNKLRTLTAGIDQKNDEFQTLIDTGDLDGDAVVSDQMKALIDAGRATCRQVRDTMKLYREAKHALEGKVKTWVKHGGSELLDIFRRTS